MVYPFIVLVTNRSGGQQRWLMNADGGNQRQLTNFDFAVWGPGVGEVSR